MWVQVGLSGGLLGRFIDRLQSDKRTAGSVYVRNNASSRLSYVYWAGYSMTLGLARLLMKMLLRHLYNYDQILAITI